MITGLVLTSLTLEVSLSGYTEASHWVLLLFFPKAWSPVCPTEIKAFSDRLEEFLYSRACALLFASTDNLDSLRAWNNTGIMEGGLGGVHMPLISDTNHRLSRAYGVLNEEMGLANRAFFLIDPTGTIRAISSNDAYVARNVSEVLRLLDALIFKDEYGEGCPADWQKGDQGIDIEKDKVEGALEVKKSFAKWLRPKLERAISSTSQFGTTQLERVTSNTPANHCHHNSNGSGPRNIGSVTSKRNSVSTDTVTITDKRPSNPNERTNSNERVQTATSRFSASAQSSGQVSPVVGQMSPMANPRSADYFASKPNASRLEVYMEEATLHQRMENMNAALENYKQSQTVGSVG